MSTSLLLILDGALSKGRQEVSLCYWKSMRVVRDDFCRVDRPFLSGFQGVVVYLVQGFLSLGLSLFCGKQLLRK